ncbi:MAG: O-antigen ligase family protein [Elusimicrobiota bacterium]
MSADTRVYINNTINEYTGKLLAYGLPILYFLISIAFYLRTYDSAQIKITLIQIGGAVILAAWLIKLIEENGFPFFKKNLIVVAPFLLFLLSGAISTALSPLKLASINELYRRIFYITFALVVIKEFDSNEKLKRLFFWLYAAAYVATVYGVIQYLDVKYFPPNPEQGLDPFIWRGAFGPRIFSTFGNPNFYGDFLVVMGPIVLADFIRTKKFHMLVLWLLITFNVINTFSKGAWLGYAVGIWVFAFLYIGYFAHGQKAKLRKVLLGMVVATLLLLSIGTYNNLRNRPDSATFRIFTWTSTWEMIKTNPVWGTGIGTFYVTYPAWRRPQIFYVEGRHNTETDHPENEYLEVWYDEGLVGFGGFLWILATFLFISFKNMNIFNQNKTDARAFYLLGIMTALIAQLAHNFVCVSLRFVSSGVFLWLLLGLIAALNTHNPLPLASRENIPQGNNPIPKGLRRVLQGGIALLAVHFISVFYGYFNADINHNIAIMFSKQANWIPALQHYNTVVKENPSFIMAHYFMGNVYNDRWSEGDPERAVGKYKDVWKLAPNYVQSHHQAGLIYLKWGEDEKRRADEARARGDIKAANEHEKKKTEVLMEALSEFTKYKTIDPIFPLNYYRMHATYRELNMPDKAEEILLEHVNFPEKLRKPPYSIWDEDYYKRRPHETSETYMNLGNFAFTRNQLDKAEVYYKKAVEIYPKALNSWKNLAVLYGRQKRYQESTDVWNKLRIMAPQDPDVQRVFQQ